MRLKIFATTLLLSAALLFLVEPMFTKMALPLLGGTAAVWITCMVFFQAGLLAGYAYAHWTTERFGARRQAALHIGVLLLALVVLPIHMPAHWIPPAGHNPAPWLLVIMLVSVGLPFFVLSTLTPTLQVWYANTGHPRAKDPYFLYGASNLGSILGLLSYPTLVEPHLCLVDQSRLWACAYTLLVALTLACAVILWRSSSDPNPHPLRPAAPNSDIASLRAELGTKPSARQRMRWVALAFVPSSLMLGMTTTLTTDFPPIPLFWVVPLTVYLLTFVLVFARQPKLDHENLIERLPFLILVAIFPVISKTEWPVWLTIILYLLALFVVSMVCHGELARTRPASAHLTEFYLWMSLGGALGGVFNALLAPLIFKQVMEYPLALVFAALLRPSLKPAKPNRRATSLDFILPLGLGALAATLIWGARALGLKPGGVLLLVFAPVLVICLSFGKRPLRFGLGVAALLLSSLLYSGSYGQTLYSGRSFFGVYRVTTDPDHRFHLMIHGNTVHGRQNLDAAHRHEPLSYYARTGPIGEIMGAYCRSAILQHVAIVGLGAGSLAGYGQPGQELIFYEIDPTVERLARNMRYFTFLGDSPSNIRVVLGDARLSLQNAADRHYGLIVLDAFSSDAIPVHLLTREALRLYLAKLSEGGILAFDISNRYLDLEPVLASLASDARLSCLVGDDSNVSAAEQEQGKDASIWVIMARRTSDLGKLERGTRWREPSARSHPKVWTDDFSNIVSVIRWWN